MKPRNTLFMAILMLCVFALTTAQSAVAGHMYAMGRSDEDTTLLEITPSPFSVASIGTATGERLSGIDFQPGTNTLFASSGGKGTNPRSLFTVDTGTGAATLVGAFGAGIFEIAFGTNGTLYGTDESNLYEVDPATGVATPIGSFVNSTRIEGIAVDPTSGILYGVNWDTVELWSIDTGTGLATSKGVFADLNAAIPGFVSVTGLGIDYGGNFFVTTGSKEGNIYAIDPADLTSGTLVGDAFGGSVTDIAFLVPEPTSIALALLGLTFCCTRIRRKK